MPLKIENLWAFISTDEEGEGVIASSIGSMLMPLVAADETRVEQLRPLAEEIAKVSKMKVILIKFSVREDLEVVGG